MNRVKTRLMLFVLSFSLVACLQKPVFTVEVFRTNTAPPSDLPVESTFTPGPPPRATFTTTPLLSATPNLTFSPIFYAFKEGYSHILLGGITETGGWLSPQDVASQFSLDMNYDFFSPNTFAQIAGSTLKLSPTCQNYFIGSSDLIPDSMVGVASHWIMEKRKTSTLATDDPAYIQALSEWFPSQGIPATEIHINRILQADLEGDGINEIFLSASYFKDASGHTAEAGDYSVVLMRKVEGNNVLTIPIIMEYYASGSPETPFPQTYTLVEALDLNQDGTLEVVVEVRRWEGGGAIVYEVNGQRVQEVIRAIC